MSGMAASSMAGRDAAESRLTYTNLTSRMKCIFGGNHFRRDFCMRTRHAEESWKMLPAINSFIVLPLSPKFLLVARARKYVLCGQASVRHIYVHGPDNVFGGASFAREIY